MVQATTEIDDAPLDEYEGLPTNNDPKGDRCYYFSVSLFYYFIYSKALSP